MKLWIKIIAGAIPAAASLLAIFLFSCRRRRQRQRHLISPQTSADFSNATGKPQFDNLHTGINNLNLSQSPRKSRRFHHLNHQPPSPGSPELPAEATFRWDEHPHLINEAVENGWQSFAFSNSIPDRPQSPGSFWALCAACDTTTQQNSPETGSELPAGSSEFMQSVRLNPSSKKPADALPSFSCVRTNLPLPGPALGGGSFPQEAYFEITVVFLKQMLSGSRTRDVDRYSDRSKLIRENSDSFGSSTQLENFTADVRRSGNLTVALGLTTGATRCRSMPGTYPGSIGFHSDGSLYLDGKKLALESEKAEWAAVNRVVGCGFDPRKKKVFFTVDSQLSHVTRCGSEEYSNPLFPILAASAEVSLLVNAGQAPFKYAPANAGRTPNPCFLLQVAGEDGGGEHTVGSVDSRELFSVTRMETEWVGQGERRKNQLSNGSLEDVLDAESDLFEIALQR